MAEDIATLAPDETIQSAARIMAEHGLGAMPVGTAEALQGILTEHDIIIRVVAAGRDAAATRVRDVMSSHVVTCGADTPLAQVAEEMAERQIRRMPVLDAAGRLIGMVTLDRRGDAETAGARGG
jgi:CBS domain-containing protein